MKLCQACEKPAVVWWHGPWCGRHALELFGSTPMEETEQVET